MEMWGFDSTTFEPKRLQLTSGAMHVTVKGGGGVDLTNDVQVVEEGRFDYETVAASQTAQVIGSTGAAGDYMRSILVVPANLNAGQVLLLDNATSITVFTGGTGSLTELKPIEIPIRLPSVNGPWKVTTGANVSCLVSGRFS